MRSVLCVAVVIILCAGVAQAQAALSAVLPDPDTVDWSSNNRPGYRYRGMLPYEQRFHDYIVAKRGRGEQLSSVDQAMIRRQQTLRRWPEAPVPNEFWMAYLRYLREQPSTQMNFAQRKMLWLAFSRGIIPVDIPADQDTQRALDYLNSRSYRARNWFERSFGRVEPWMEHYASSLGVDMGQGSVAAAQGVFPPDEPFNGLRINYNVTGIDLGVYEDVPGFMTRRDYTGTVRPGQVTVSGSASADVGFYATLRVYLQVGGRTVDDEWRIEVPGKQDFSVTLDVPPDVNLEFPTPQFFIRLQGRYSTGGTAFGRSLQVGGRLEGDPQAIRQQRARADAEWRAEVERTLRELGYQQTPAGREVERMRQAMAGGDQAWRDYVDRRQRELGNQEGLPEAQFDALEQAMQVGGDAWRQYTAGQGGSSQPAGSPTASPGPTVPPAPPAPSSPAARAPGDIGRVTVGTGSDGNTIIGASDHFDRTSRVTGAMNYQNLPADSTAVAIWHHNGDELARRQRQIGGTGSVSFTLRTGGGEDLPSGDYTLTIMVGDQILGRKSFTIGPPQTVDRGTGATPGPRSGPDMRLAITEPSDNQQVSRNVTIRGTAAPGSRIRVTVSYWYRVVFEGYATQHQVDLTADTSGNWSTDELDFRVPLAGMVRSYRIKAEQLGTDGAVVGEHGIEVRGR